MVEGVRLESVCAQKVPRVQIPLSPNEVRRERDLKGFCG